LVICGFLNDDKILNKTDDEEPPVSSNEAKLSLRAVLSFLQRHDIDDSVFCNILNLDNTINRVSANGYTQKKNNLFFKKINKYVCNKQKMYECIQ
jgi:hypothetical protein